MKVYRVKIEDSTSFLLSADSDGEIFERVAVLVASEDVRFKMFKRGSSYVSILPLGAVE